MPATVAERNGMLNAYLPGASHASYSGNSSLFLSLHTADPGDTGASEYTTYTGNRPSISFGGASSASASSTAQIDFASMGATTITHVGVWSAATAGTFKGGGALTSSRTTASGDTLRFIAAAVTATL
jgi:hypothetical protein